MEQRSFHFHHCDIRRRKLELEPMDLQRLLDQKLVDSFRLHQQSIPMDNIAEWYQEQEQCPIRKHHQSYAFQLNILPKVHQLELECQLEMGLYREVVKINSSSIRNSCHLRMQLQLKLWLQLGLSLTRALDPQQRIQLYLLSGSFLCFSANSFEHF